jgi:hypothetical protein
VNLPAEPLHITPFVTSAFTVLIGTFTATDAPTPTLEPLPPPSEGSARTELDMLVAAPMVTSCPPVMVTDAVLAASFGATFVSGARPTTASVSMITTLTAIEPATPILPPPAPEVASVTKESVWSTSFWLVLPEPLSAIALPLRASSAEAASWNLPPVRSIT